MVKYILCTLYIPVWIMFAMFAVMDSLVGFKYFCALAVAHPAVSCSNGKTTDLQKDIDSERKKEKARKRERQPQRERRLSLLP